jgi:hypothetical protein
VAQLSTLGDFTVQDISSIIELLRSSWGTKTLEDFRLESARHRDGGVFEAMRGDGGRRMIIFLCATRPDDISRFVREFSLIDDGAVADWKAFTLLDLLMASKDSGSSFACLRHKDGRRRALIFIAHDPRSISTVERFFGLEP